MEASRGGRAGRFRISRRGDGHGSIVAIRRLAREPVRGMQPIVLLSSSLLIVVGGCQGTLVGDDPALAGGGDGRGSPAVTADGGGLSGAACPVDPDCASTGSCRPGECPDYWLCEDLAGMAGKRCTNPGPDYPDRGQPWRCRDEDGKTICEGSTLPEGSGDGSFSCEQRGEFVVCEQAMPAYPDGQGAGPWTCRFAGEFRVCESRPSVDGGVPVAADDGGATGVDAGVPPSGGDWVCAMEAGERVCRLATPSFPDDRSWDCHDAGTATTVCTAPGPLPTPSPQWRCASVGGGTVCSRSPEHPDGGGATGWSCFFDGEQRVCIESGGPPGTVCTAGQQRWCDDAIYCSWGKQVCAADGRWGHCVEPEVVRGQPTDRPNNACACRAFYFLASCCEDQEDRDRDGEADCLVPADHVAPTCG